MLRSVQSSLDVWTCQSHLVPRLQRALTSAEPLTFRLQWRWRPAIRVTRNLSSIPRRMNHESLPFFRRGLLLLFFFARVLLQFAICAATANGFREKVATSHHFYSAAIAFDFPQTLPPCIASSKPQNGEPAETPPYEIDKVSRHGSVVSFTTLHVRQPTPLLFSQTL